MNRGGWFNAFGTVKVRRGQTKRWNIRIIDRTRSDPSSAHFTGMNGGNGSYPGSGSTRAASLMLGVVESNRAKAQDKDGGFWEKEMGGYALSGSDGKLYHVKGMGKAYGVPLCAGSVVGIELDRMITPGRELSGHKSKVQGAECEGGILRFYVNGQDLGIACYGLNAEDGYSLAVSLDGSAYALQIIE